MEDKFIIEKRKNGVFYTPKILARYLIDNLIDGSDISIFDPAYGDGALLLAAEEIFNEKSFPKSRIEIFGCDINPVNGLLKHLPQANLVKSDFFDYDVPKKFDLVLTNPPYVRHQNLDSKIAKSYRLKNPSLKYISGQADLWAYFLLRSISFLNYGGSIGAILPWAFLQADYAKKIREILLENFGEITYMALSGKYFESTQERIVLVWLKNFGGQSQTLKFSQSNSIDGQQNFVSITKESWIKNNIVYYFQNNLELLLSKYKYALNFIELDRYAFVKIGIVTGADRYFIKKIVEIDNLRLNNKNLISIITSAKELQSYLSCDLNVLKKLIYLKEEDQSQNIHFINQGIIENIHLRSHSKLRKPWYSVKIGDLPDAFFPYRVGKMPYMVLNNLNIQCTNSIHRIYFKNINIVQRRWIQVSTLTKYFQISIYYYSKTYGRGMLKIEPSILKKSLVFISDNDSINNVYFGVQDFLKKGEKVNAINYATDFFNNALNIPDDIIKETDIVWKIIQRKDTKID